MSEDEYSRAFEEWDARVPFPHRLTAPEATQARRMAWNAALEHAAAIFPGLVHDEEGTCECPVCARYAEAILRLRCPQ